MQVVVIGAGAWGTVMALHAKRCSHQVHLVCRTPAQRQNLAHDRENKNYLPGFSLDGIQFNTPADLPTRADIVMVALPSHAYAEGLKNIKISAPVWTSLSKGVMLETLQTPCQTLEKILGTASGVKVLSLSGPTHARSVAEKLPCAMVLSGEGDNTNLQEALSNSLMRIYASHDRLGAELGGALKNAFAVAAGVCDGLRLGDNAKASLLTRALSEMARLGVALGGHEDTFFGLTGIGDLMATSYGVWSRNRQLGEHVAKGENAQTLVEKGLTAEGFRASKALLALAQQHQIRAPILGEIVAVLHEGLPPLTAMKNLMERPLKKE